MKLKTTLGIDREEILEAIKTHIEAKGYKIVGDIRLDIDKGQEGGYDLHDGDYIPASLKGAFCEIEGMEMDCLSKPRWPDLENIEKKDEYKYIPPKPSRTLTT